MGAIPALPGLLCLSLKKSSTGVQTETPGPVGTTLLTPGARVGSTHGSAGARTMLGLSGPPI